MKFTKYVSHIALVMVFIFAAFVAVVPARAWDGAPIEFDWSGIISQALQTLILATVPVLAGLAARWINVKYQAERARLTEQQRYMLDAFIRTVVFAAEQLKVTEQIDNKLDYVEMLVQDWVDNHGLTMNAEEIRARIEAAVKQEFPKPQGVG